jgi:hypothetical protein
MSMDTSQITGDPGLYGSLIGIGDDEYAARINARTGTHCALPADLQEEMVVYRRLATNSRDWLEDVAVPAARFNEADLEPLPPRIPRGIKRMTRAELDTKYPGMKRE